MSQTRDFSNITLPGFGPIPAQAVTHGGKFHADDVFSTALLRILRPDIQVRRVMQAPEEEGLLCFDIGFGPYDHHQKGAPVRENGVPYAAFGLLWRDLGPQLVGQAEADRLDENLVQPLDLNDNTGAPHDLADLVAVFNPAWDSDQQPDDCFWQAVEVVQAYLSRKLESIWSVQRARAVVEPALAKMQDGVVVLEPYAPWKQVLLDSPALFVVYPSQRGGYSAQGIPQSQEDPQLRCSFPAQWAGKSPAELAALSGLPGLRFCHNNGFLIAADSREEAIAACRLAREMQGL